MGSGLGVGALPSRFWVGSPFVFLLLHHNTTAAPPRVTLLFCYNAPKSLTHLLITAIYPRLYEQSSYPHQNFNH